MRFYKASKSLDYIIHPIYEEVSEIKQSINECLGNFKDCLLSALVSLLMERMYPVIPYIVDARQAVKNNTASAVQCFWANELTELCIVLTLVIVIFFGIPALCGAIRPIINGNGKRTEDQRNAFAEQFYNNWIPQLIEVKSIIEKIAEIQDVQSNERSIFLCEAVFRLEKLTENVAEKQPIAYSYGKDSSTTIRRIDSETIIKLIGGNIAYKSFLHGIMLALQCMNDYLDESMPSLQIALGEIIDKETVFDEGFLVEVDMWKDYVKIRNRIREKLIISEKVV